MPRESTYDKINSMIFSELTDRT